MGAHEYLGHKIMGWKENTQTHYLVYLYQMNHRSWGKTTKDFKRLAGIGLSESIWNNINAEIWNETRILDKQKAVAEGKKPAVDDEKAIRNKEATERLKILRSYGLWPQHNLSGNDSIQFNEYLKKRLYDPNRKNNPFIK
jgi:hypothetical protein